MKSSSIISIQPFHANPNDIASETLEGVCVKKVSRVAVTGANGFIGSNLLTTFSKMGVEVQAIVRESRRPHFPTSMDAPNITYHDIGLDSVPQLARAMDGVDAVIHLAGRTSARSYRDFLEVNRNGTRNLLTAARSVQSHPRVVLVSSLAAAGPSTRAKPLEESQVPKPVSKYGRSKLASEKIAMRFAKDLPITIIRPGIVFGPVDRAILTLVQSIYRLRANPIAGFHLPKFSFVHVDDLNSAIIRATEMGATLPDSPLENPGRGIYFVADPDSCTFSQFGEWIAQGLGEHWHFDMFLPIWMIGSLAWLNEHASRWLGVTETFNVDKIREAASEGWECDVNAAITELKWKPGADLSERVRQTIEWYRSQRWLT